MAATIQIHEMTTNADTGINKTSGTVRFKAVASTTSTAADDRPPSLGPRLPGGRLRRDRRPSADLARA